ncbi:hypothetical protein Nepgr_025889 [Nepenthes gracilis]|uniref:Uncharacterized protein n=1 Tax=Nepenthes gracilis TaxID=150966 RepID=A0AAD3Y1Z0_NEPGR|nr:hypothetical protein Nepgr_025889 [Nepenthes gracilis]
MPCIYFSTVVATTRLSEAAGWWCGLCEVGGSVSGGENLMIVMEWWHCGGGSCNMMVGGSNMMAVAEKWWWIDGGGCRVKVKADGNNMMVLAV